MSRPQHLSTPNTPAGIRRINEDQARYDKNPEAYEREEKQHTENRRREEEEREI